MKILRTAIVPVDTDYRSIYPGDKLQDWMDPEDYTVMREVDLEYDRKIHNLIAACINLYQADLRYSKITAENDIYEVLKDLGEIKNENS